FYIDDAGARRAQGGIAVAVLREQRCQLGQIDRHVARARRGSGGEVEWQLTVCVAAAAVVADLAGPYLMPGRRHVEDEPVAVDGLKRERRVGWDLGEEAGVGVTFGVENRIAAAVELAQRNLAQDAQPLHGVAVEELAATGAAVRAVAAMRPGFHGEQ